MIHHSGHRIDKWQEHFDYSKNQTTYIELPNYAIQKGQRKTYQGKLDIGHLYELPEVLLRHICKQKESISMYLNNLDRKNNLIWDLWHKLLRWSMCFLAPPASRHWSTNAFRLWQPWSVIKEMQRTSLLYHFILQQVTIIWKSKLSNSIDYEIQLYQGSTNNYMPNYQEFVWITIQTHDIQNLTTGTMQNDRWQCYKNFGLKLLLYKSTKVVEYRYSNLEHSDANHLNHIYLMKANIVCTL